MRRLVIVFFIIFFCLFGLFLYVFLVSPYSTLTLNPSPFITAIDANNEITLSQKSNVILLEGSLLQRVAFIFSGLRIAQNALSPEPKISGSLQQIIATIHKERFDPAKSYIISGGHFIDLYPRNIGIFYNALLDPCIKTTKKDWENRERISVQSLALVLELMRQGKKESTTYMPVGPEVFTPVNIYTRPSDSLYSILFTLSQMTKQSKKGCYPIQTSKVAQQLLANYKPTLTRLLNQYQKDVVDPNTNLVKKNITLSSARDGIQRQSSFYDNVILWATLKKAKELNLSHIADTELENLKEHIINAFWDKEGLFIDDLSQDSIKTHRFSADELIVIQTGFLETQRTSEKEMLKNMISYVEKNPPLTTPLPIFYATSDQPDKLYFWVKRFAPSYMGQTIWSHWGIEYIKALILLGKENPQYLLQARMYLTMYAQTMQKFEGYPEVYDKTGTPYKGPLYRSVLHTGWVINYEAAKGMLEEYRN